MSFDLGHVARDLGLPLDKVQRTVEMLDEGNTVPFITRYRKDQTGGLDEEVIRDIADRVARLRLLLERKQTILKSIEAQGKLTPELANQINSADSLKRLEDLYLPYKPKKQTLATKAREQGLEPFALEILNADEAANDLEARAAQFVDAEKNLPTNTEVLEGVGYLIAERFSERADVRGRLRRILWRTGKLVTTRIEPAEKPAEAPAELETTAPVAAESTVTETTTAVEPTGENVESPAVEPPAVEAEAPVASETPAETTTEQAPVIASEAVPASEATAAAESPAVEPPAAEAVPAAESLPPAEVVPAADSPATETTAAALPAAAPPTVPPLKAEKKKKKKKKKKEPAALDAAFKDYFDYHEPAAHIPPHRVLAINRGERAKVLRVKIDVDRAAMYREIEPILVGADHPHGDFLRHCLEDSLERLIIPSLEREARREMTEKSEQHAVEVFVRNLRKLLLQPPVNGRRVLAIDPGFKSGCKLAALDEFGNVLGHAIIHVVGNEERRKKGRETIVDLLRTHNISVVAIGNGTGCRDAEQLTAEIIATELADRDVQYCIVNEAGASVYSTSPIGREEFPGYDPLLRSAISIGRRLLDPLSELVKINPANIGVGLYQHDIKAKHLRDSLDAVVESAVNYVGVDVNTASPALLRYVSGLNQLTARRLYEHRAEHGPFKSREQFKDVIGFGDATFVQAAGFLKIFGGQNALDATWIHPESYDVATRILDKLDSSLSELAVHVPPPAPPRKETPLGKIIKHTPAGPSFAAGIKTPETGETAEPAAVVAEEPSPAIPETEPTVVESAEPVETAETPEAATAESAPPTVTEPTPAAAPVAEAVETAEVTEVTAPAAETTETAEPASSAETPAVEAAPASKGPSLAERAAQASAAEFAQELEVGELLCRDILASLSRPGRDPREDLAAPIFRRGIMKLEDLEAGMELQGTVLNVVDFGAFVDIGLSDSGLVHISRLADRYVRDPHEVVGVGDVLKVWVVEVDKQRRRVSLTAIEPGTEKPPQPKREKRERPPRNRPPRQPQAAATGDAQASAAPPAPRTSRPARPAAAQGEGARPAPTSRPPFRGGGGGGASKGPRGPAPTVGSKKMLSKQLKTKKTVKPKAALTKEMEEGAAPMRSFSDLVQFMKKKDEPGDEGASK
jgi:uncharacterized protein